MPRPPVLDEVKRGQIVALASSGFSRRSIARYVGCAAATIENTAERLPAFAEQLGEAERKFVQTHSDNIARHAANSWRASAWLMQHLQPEEFARRSTRAPAPAQNANQFAAWSRELLAAVPLYMRGDVQRVTCDMRANLRNGNSDIPTEHPPGDETPPRPPVTAPYPAPPYPAPHADPRVVARLFKLFQAEATGVTEQVASAAVNSIFQNHPVGAVEVAGLADPRSIKPAPASAPQSAAQTAERTGAMHGNTPADSPPLDAPPLDAPPLDAPPADALPSPIPTTAPACPPRAASALLMLLVFLVGGLAHSIVGLAFRSAGPRPQPPLAVPAAADAATATNHQRSETEQNPLDVPRAPLNNPARPASQAASSGADSMALVRILDLTGIDQPHFFARHFPGIRLLRSGSAVGTCSRSPGRASAIHNWRRSVPMRSDCSQAPRLAASRRSPGGHVNQDVAEPLAGPPRATTGGNHSRGAAVQFDSAAIWIWPAFVRRSARPPPARPNLRPAVCRAPLAFPVSRKCIENIAGCFSRPPHHRPSLASMRGIWRSVDNCPAPFRVPNEDKLVCRFLEILVAEMVEPTVQCDPNPARLNHDSTRAQATNSRRQQIVLHILRLPWQNSRLGEQLPALRRQHVQAD
jgi:hypothetical protein